MGLGVIGLEAQGLAEAGHAIRHLALLGQGHAEVVVGLGEVRLEVHGSAEGDHGLVYLAELGQGQTQAGAAGRRLGHLEQGLP
jgi:hypothetical protein